MKILLSAGSTATVTAVMAIVLFTSVPVAANDTEPDENTQAAEVESEDPNDIICRSERQTGSRISTRVCRTRAQLESEEEDARDFINRSRDRAAQIERPRG